MKKKSLAAALTLGLVTAGISTAFSVSPEIAQAAACKTWHDSNTFGAMCPNKAITAKATCKNGAIKYGMSVLPGYWSYAYCSAHGGLKSGKIV